MLDLITPKYHPHPGIRIPGATFFYITFFFFYHSLLPCDPLGIADWGALTSAAGCAPVNSWRGVGWVIWWRAGRLVFIECARFGMATLQTTKSFVVVNVETGAAVVVDGLVPGDYGDCDLAKHMAEFGLKKGLYRTAELSKNIVLFTPSE